jgi:predicted Rossmann fold nucleotide-binding protein DprA/Smf involved in DNA uptake
VVVYSAEAIRLLPESERYPPRFRACLAVSPLPVISARGNLAILDDKLLALFCSARCPGDLIVKTYDLARNLRESGVTVISGFHSPMERECLVLLLRGAQPVIVCPARGIDGMRVPRDWRGALEEGRLLLLSPFAESIRRPTASLAATRNDFVAAIADRVFVAHAAPGSRTAAFCRRLRMLGKPLLTFDRPANAALLALGAITVNPDCSHQIHAF